jgi:hypothetical protein
MAKLTEADKKFIEEFLNGAQLKETYSDDEKVVRRNRFSGQPAELDPVCAAAHDFIFKVEAAFHNKEALARIHPKLTIRNQISKFDRAKMIVQKLDPAAYMTLID